VFPEALKAIKPHRSTCWPAFESLFWCCYNVIRMHSLATKLPSPYTGPNEVIQQQNYDVECFHLVMGNIKLLLVTRLKLFFGFEIEVLDADQYVIHRRFITGEVTRRSSQKCFSSPNLHIEIIFFFLFPTGNQRIRPVNCNFLRWDFIQTMRLSEHSHEKKNHENYQHRWCVLSGPSVFTLWSGW